MAQWGGIEPISFRYYLSAIRHRRGHMYFSTDGK